MFSQLELRAEAHILSSSVMLSFGTLPIFFFANFFNKVHIAFLHLDANSITKKVVVHFSEIISVLLQRI